MERSVIKRLYIVYLTLLLCLFKMEDTIVYINWLICPSLDHRKYESLLFLKYWLQSNQGKESRPLYIDSHAYL
jgi:hypothetical protein